MNSNTPSFPLYLPGIDSFVRVTPSPPTIRVTVPSASNARTLSGKECKSPLPIWLLTLLVYFVPSKKDALGLFADALPIATLEPVNTVFPDLTNAPPPTDIKLIDASISSADS